MQIQNKKLNTDYQILNTQSGFTLLFAALVGALVLTVGMAILSITLKQLMLASAGKATQQAFYSADAGVECALYLDRGAGISNCRLGFFYAPNADPELSHQYAGAWSCLDEYPEYETNNIRCMGKDIDFDSVSVDQTTGNVITQFSLDSNSSPSGDSADNGGMCFSVVVTKMTDSAPSLANATIIESRGYNTCNEQAVNRFERAIRSINQ